MQTMRRQWIDEGKQRNSDKDDVNPTENEQMDQIKGATAGTDGSERVEGHASSPKSPPYSGSGTPPDATAVPGQDAVPAAIESTTASSKSIDEGYHSLFVPEEDTGAPREGDELDMLLAEDEAMRGDATPLISGHKPTQAICQIVGDDFRDEMEAMAGMDDM